MNTFINEHTPRTLKMSEQEVTFSTVRFHKRSGLQNHVRREETQVPREPGHRVCSVHWYLIVIALGILYSLRLVIFAVLVTNIFQYNHEKQELQKILHHYHNCCTKQNDIKLKEEILRNMSVECREGYNLLKCPYREEHRWYSETKTVLNSSHCIGRGEVHWFCYGIKCYYFINNDRKWSGCFQTCHNISLSLLKIDDKDEQELLRCQIIPDTYWIGPKYDNKKIEWDWVDNGPSKLDLMAMKSEKKTGGCAVFSMTGIHSDDCGKKYPCICEKRMDKVPASVCSVKERSQSAV
ncbi:killer cell lectin-like receptor 5 [Grammomys surdaster]|uniref:killer cell lectin-like receptor 5 n=1 Tax=Grammomys surdaster TaxID=491861 RepID=UPI0010A05228|nr:killer cell lectin-like receptor 5 [Grammomys surdaster]